MPKDSVCECAFPAEFGIAPQPLETVVPSYLGPEAIKSRYDGYRVRGAR